MFEVGDYMVYGSHGICRVEAVGPMELSVAQKGRLYYTLSPLYLNGSTVYTPVDNLKVVMRPILSKREALDFIEKIPEIDQLWVPDEKGREQIYKAALKTCECMDLIKIIKTLYLRKQSRLEDGKKVTSVDVKYLKLAEDQLYGELAIPLGMEKDKVEEYITDRVNRIVETQ